MVLLLIILHVCVPVVEKIKISHYLGNMKTRFGILFKKLQCTTNWRFKTRKCMTQNIMVISKFKGYFMV